MVVSETIAYASLFSLTIFFSAFALGTTDKLWRVALKFIAGLFWMIMAVAQFFFFGSEAFLMVISLPYAIFGMLFWFAIMNDFLGEKKKRIWDFDDV